MKVPSSPFTTRLSGSAKETELRIRNIFQWKKKRPPVIALVAAVLVIVFCGALIGFDNNPRNGTLGEIYQEYFAENPISYISYENKEDWGYPSLTPESENFGVAAEYVQSMELRFVLGHKQYIGDFNNRNGAVVLRSANGQELWIDLYPTGYVVVSGEGAGRLDKGDDARVYQVSGAFDVEVFLSYLASELSEEENADITQDNVPAPNPITVDLSQEPPLTEADFALAVPDFLTEEQQLLYRKARNLYEHIFGADTSGVAYGPIPASAEYKTLERNGYTYTRSNGRYSDWNTFDAVVHSVFTDAFFQSKNTVPLYLEQDGYLYFLPAGRGCGYFYNDNFPDEFRLISQNDTTIKFVVIGHYSEGWPREGETSEENIRRLEREYEYTYEFPITMVMTRNGWRFDQFYSPLTDEVGPESVIRQEETGLYYSKTYTLTVADGRELTLLIEGVLMEDRKNYYRLSKLELYDGYDRLQTIDVNLIEFDGDYLFEGLYVAEGTGPYGEPIVWDINFDGNQDISFLCCDVFPINIPYAHFLWNEETQQLTFNTVLCAYLEQDEGNHRLIEQIVGSAGTYDQYNTYEFNADGQLILVDSEIIYRT